VNPQALAVLASPADFVYARSQMALSLGWHIVVACFGVAFPAMVVFAEWRGHRGDPELSRLAHTWARAMGVLFASARSPAPSSPSRWACCGPG